MVDENFDRCMVGSDKGGRSYLARGLPASPDIARELFQGTTGVVKSTDVAPPLYRVREGQYRILFTIDDDKLIILVVRIGHHGRVPRITL